MVNEADASVGNPEAPAAGGPGPPIAGIGASAGGLEALKALFQSMPADTGLAFVVVIHLNPGHPSQIAEILARFTTMPVVQVQQPTPVEADHVYVLPPGKFIGIRNGALQLSEPVLRHGLRLPIDWFFRSLAEDRAERAIGIVLSGAGSDGSLGVKAIKGAGGMIMVQAPETAQHDNMPRAAIATGAVDYVQPVGELPETLLRYVTHASLRERPGVEALVTVGQLGSILALLRACTQHDFHYYKEGTLLRRITRRMGLHHSKTPADYLALLRREPNELKQLAQDLMIGVTAFFRDPQAFEALGDLVLAPLVRTRQADDPIRVWVAGCGTGEEAYTIGMLLLEQLQKAQQSCPLQIFASDIDETALATARAGVYPENISADVSTARLRQFFVKGDHNVYRVSKRLRETVTFAVQDLIVDPPFSRLDLISCRNLLIYLKPEVQRKVIALFHFALKPGGYLLLGNAETISQQRDLFEPVSESCRLYRRVGIAPRQRVEFPIVSALDSAVAPSSTGTALRLDAARLAELTQQRLLADYAPAAVLINASSQILYFHGPTDRYLKQPSGVPTDDLLTRVREGLPGALRGAIERAGQRRQSVTVSGVRMARENHPAPVRLTVKPLTIPKSAEGLLLVTFEDQPRPAAATGKRRTSKAEQSLVEQLQQELKDTREELQNIIEEQETTTEELKVANEEVTSVNEELQSTNEELETTKEELQSMNEELSTINSQLRDKVAELSAANDDLANLLSSTAIATLFLDTRFQIKRFTPAARYLFKLRAGDVGRPLSDIVPTVADDTLFVDATNVLEKLVPLENEVRTDNGQWYLRRILPYRTQDDRIAGVVVTFFDITRRKQAEIDLKTAKDEAEQANVAKSRFLAAVSHDLRQPLQAIDMMQSILAHSIEEPAMQTLIGNLGESVHAMDRMLTRLLDLNQLEEGVIQPRPDEIAVQSLLARIRSDFTPIAEAKGLALRAVSSSAVIRSDPELLQDILHNLVANAVKYTEQGKVLVGCRRRGDKLRLEVRDTGPGIPGEQRERIFEEFYQIDNPARDRSRGHGLGLAIVERLARLLGHRLEVRSTPGKGSLFAIELPRVAGRKARLQPPGGALPPATDGASILLVEDDSAVRDAMQWLLRLSGYQVVAADSGQAALQLIEQQALQPDLILSDLRLSGRLDGAETLQKARQMLKRDIPAILITGDLTAEKPGGQQDYVMLRKPVSDADLMGTLQRLLGSADDDGRT